MNATDAAALTADDVFANPEFDRCEFADGVIVEKDMSGITGAVEALVLIELGLYRRQHGGCAFGSSTAYRCYPEDPEKFRRPDASFIRSGRLPNDLPPEGFVTIQPDLAVEIISPNDLYYEVEHKTDEYLAAGVPLVWLINPGNQTVRVFRSGAAVRQLGPHDILTGDDILPGFQCQVAGLFPPLPK